MPVYGRFISNLCIQQPVKCIYLFNVLVISLAEYISDIVKQKLYTNPDCDKSETHTVREWLGRFGINLDDEYFIKWNQTLVDLSQFLHDIENTVIKEDMLKLQEIIIRGLYLVYNKDKDFYKQFEENVFMLTELIKLFSGYLKGEINLE